MACAGQAGRAQIAHAQASSERVAEMEAIKPSVDRIEIRE